VRDLGWEGCFNVRDLGGLRTVDGRVTLPGRVVRADALDRLTSAGWAALTAYGVRTIIDLRNDDEHGGDLTPRPASVMTHHLPLDGAEDREFWDVWDSGPQFGTPLYYRPHLERMPERSAAVLASIAGAPPGGVVFHCGVGRDRAGLITMLLLALVDVTPEDIVADYVLSAERLTARAAVLGEDDQEPILSAYMADQGTTAAEVLRRVVADLDDVRALLARGGLTAQDVTTLQRRLLEP
jgi:protein-tyrosine phosphatase